VSHFVADLGVLIQDGMKRYGKDGFKPGDVILTNHQAVAGQHLNNVVIYVPCFFEGELQMFTMVRAHWIDVGGASTGFGAGPSVPDPWMEGLQFDQLKIYEGGEVNEMLYRMVSDNIRFPESSMGDMKSQIAACRLGVRRLEELFRRYGRQTVLACLSKIYEETEQKCRNVVSQFKDGVYEAESFLDGDGINPTDKIHVKVKVTIDRGHMTIDMTGSSPERPVSVNARTYAGPRIAYKALTGPLEPVNEGAFRALKCIIPEGSIMMARYPTPMAQWSTTINLTVDTTLKALAPAMKDRTPAAHHAHMGGHTFFGTHPGTGRRFVLQTIDGGGWGGRPFEDGESGAVSSCQGDVRNGSIEGIEMKCPLLIEGRALRADSAGAGRWRGGLGIDLQVRNFTEGRWNFTRTHREGCPPWGLWNGGTGKGGGYLLRRKGESEYKGVSGMRQPVPADAQVIGQSPGGGGWGDPFEREPERVQWDVIEGYVSMESARRDYGVALREDFSIDEAATAALRKRPAAQRGAAA
jgi:N-methylhydantoinase B